MKTFIKYLTALLAGIFLFQELSAERRPRFEYDLNFDFRFDNREYDASSFSPSMTVLGARLTPVAGLSFTQGKFSHTVMAGADLLKDFGTPKIAAEIQLYYAMEARLGKTSLSLHAGAFPRRFMQGDYSTAFFSDSLSFYDGTLEGALLSFTPPRSYYEVGCDWNGKFGTSREKFMLFSSGRSLVTDFLQLGYAATVFHFAGSEIVRGVVDNILVNPYVSFELDRYIGADVFSLRLGYLQSFQNDRRNVGEYVFPGGGEFVVALENWNVGVRNRLYYGCGLMPYYDSVDAAGVKYGNELYYGDSFYRVEPGAASSSGSGSSSGAGSASASVSGSGSGSASARGIYDRLEVYYAPHITEFVGIKVAVIAHFHGNGFSGWQQVVGINVDLNRGMFRK